eukprot:CAMPEP_0177696444 /NCGR_PEP_ID=MMETSP0484_2-20121128/3983_1 /TAXON_ID=354590 /ORGANISM="Rhodomonas lens, Strain RHODO" /LENGTH=223 /DNA_ID=CAMNT_0019207415 /DNA_START=125 /DNA_END=796 /DNA_ORIENTATION=-
MSAVLRDLRVHPSKSQAAFSIAQCRPVLGVQSQGHVGRRFVSVDATDVKRGQVIEYRGSKCVVVKTSVNVTNRKAFAMLDLRDMKTGTTRQEKLRSNEKVEKIFVTNVKVVYLYDQGPEFVFQNPDTFEDILVPAKLMEGFEKFLQEGMEGQVVLDEGGEVLSFLPPRKLTCTVEELKGSGGKIAQLDIGISVQVPPFIQAGDRIVVDVEDQKYLTRATDDAE